MVLQKVRFESLARTAPDFDHLYALLSPHLANCGYGNTGWIGDYKGFPMFFAEHHGVTSPEPSLVGTVDQDVGGIRRRLRWMAGSLRALPDGMGIYPEQRTGTLPSPARSTWLPATASS